MIPYSFNPEVRINGSLYTGIQSSYPVRKENEAILKFLFEKHKIWFKRDRNMMIVFMSGVFFVVVDFRKNVDLGLAIELLEAEYSCFDAKVKEFNQQLSTLKDFIQFINLPQFDGLSELVKSLDKSIHDYKVDIKKDFDLLVEMVIPKKRGPK